MTRIVRRSGDQPVSTTSGEPARKHRSLPVPCWVLLRKHRFDGPQKYEPGRKLKMKRQCSACGQMVAGGQILLNDEE